jgi:hypothetical protein
MRVDFQSGHARGPDADVMWGLDPASACVDEAGGCLIQTCEMISLLYILLKFDVPDQTFGFDGDRYHFCCLMFAGAELHVPNGLQPSTPHAP